jgi:hypothetical protein
VAGLQDGEEPQFGGIGVLPHLLPATLQAVLAIYRSARNPS